MSRKEKIVFFSGWAVAALLLLGWWQGSTLFAAAPPADNSLLSGYHTLYKIKEQHALLQQDLMSAQERFQQQQNIVQFGEQLLAEQANATTITIAEYPYRADAVQRDIISRKASLEQLELEVLQAQHRAAQAEMAEQQLQQLIDTMRQTVDDADAEQAELDALSEYELVRSSDTIFPFWSKRLERARESFESHLRQTKANRLIGTFDVEQMLSVDHEYIPDSYWLAAVPQYTSGLGLVKAGKYSEALAWVQRQIKSDAITEDTVPLLIAIGVGHMEQGNFSTALGAFNTAETTDVFNLSVRTYKAICLYFLGRIDVAVDMLQDLTSESYGEATLALAHLLKIRNSWGDDCEVVYEQVMTRFSDETVLREAEVGHDTVRNHTPNSTLNFVVRSELLNKIVLIPTKK